MSYFLARTQGLNFVQIVQIVHIYKKICVFKYYKYQYNSDRLFQKENVFFESA